MCLTYCDEDLWKTDLYPREYPECGPDTGSSSPSWETEQSSSWLTHSGWGKEFFNRGPRYFWYLFEAEDCWWASFVDELFEQSTLTHSRIQELNPGLSESSLLWQGHHTLYVNIQEQGGSWSLLSGSAVLSTGQRELPVSQHTHPTLVHCPPFALSCCVPSIQGVRGIIKTALHASQPSSGPLCYAWHSHNLAKPPKPLFS